MPSVNPATYHQSATSNAAFKACPTRFRLGYREGLRLAENTDSQRQGTNWGALHETYANRYSEWMTTSPEATVEGAAREALQAALEHLNEKYATCPSHKTLPEWALERQILLTSFIGYLWYFQNDSIEYLASELAFELPIIEPKTGLPVPLSQAVQVGKMDHLIKWQGMVGVQERKSTSKSLDGDSDYWKRSAKDDQISMYALALRALAGKTIQVPADCRHGNTLLDVWHKPTISPKMLTQADTAKFIETGEYMGQKFTVERPMAPAGNAAYLVNGESVEIEPGKKGFAIRESVEMFGARLLTDIYARPEFYYCRKEIIRTDAELDAFQVSCYNVYQTQRMMEKNNLWYDNHDACQATFKCPMMGICFGPGANAVCDGKTTPPGYKRIFVDLTVNEQPVEV